MNKIAYILKNPLRLFSILLSRMPFMDFVKGTTEYQCRISVDFWICQKILNQGANRNVYWPVHRNSKIVSPENILIGVDTNPGMMPGCYIQGLGKIRIGDYTQIAPNVVMISANHNLYDTREHILGEVNIGKYCWIGAGAQIMPNVRLGDFTIVGAGSVVTKSFEDGYCVIAGNPARLIKQLEPEKCIRYEYNQKFYGYIREADFEAYRRKHLKV